MAYISETIELPLQLRAPAPAKTMCCKERMHRLQTGQGKCGSGKCGSGKCKETACCANCPICYLSTFQPAFSVTPVSAAVKKSYPCIEINLAPGYNGASWKPPNAA